MKSLKYALLASSILTTVGSSAWAATLLEGGSDVFPESPPGTNVDFSQFQTVQGFLNTETDPVDLFTFTGLTAGANFEITFFRGNPNCVASCDFEFSAGGFTDTLTPGTSATHVGVLAATTLAVSVTNPGGEPLSFGEGYSVTLREIPAGVPAPSAAAIFAVGLTGLAIARRKRRR